MKPLVFRPFPVSFNHLITYISWIAKRGKHRQAYYKRFGLRNVFLLYPCYMDKGNCLSIWQSIR